MVKFDVVLIARNEDKTLPRLLESLNEFKSLGGKVYILDTGSKDNTVQVAKQWGCHVEEVGDKFRITINKELADQINAFTTTQIVKDGDSVFDYASARNYIANFATHDMIATPDCDEIWTKFNIDKINQAVEQADQLEYNFVFAHDENGKELVKFLHSKFYNRNKMKWVGIIHEVLQGEGKRLFLDESIIKLEHWQNPETNRSGYLPGLAIDCYTNQDNDRNAHYFGRELMYHGYFEAAIKQLERHIAMDKWPTERSQSMIFIGDCLQYMNKFDASWYLKAFDLEPNRREPLMKLAEYYYQQGKKEQTRAYGEAALTIQGNNFYANYQPYYEDRPHELLYWAWDGIDKAKSDYHWDQAYKFNPHNTKTLSGASYRFNLPKVSIIIPQLGREEGLKRCLDSIKNLDYPNALIEPIVVEGEETVPIKVQKGLEKSTGEYICYAANDVEFTPDSLKIAIQDSIKLNKGLVSFTSGSLLPDNGNICEHFIIKRELIDKLEARQIFSTDFNHVGVDNWLWAQATKLDTSYRSTAFIHHYHFSKGAELDNVYKRGWDKVMRDREILQNKLSKL